jgi:hypothetical protein
MKKRLGGQYYFFQARRGSPMRVRNFSLPQCSVLESAPRQKWVSAQFILPTGATSSR